MPNDLQLSDQDEVLLESLVLAASDNVTRAPGSDRSQFAPTRRRVFVETDGNENVYLGTGNAWVDVSENTGLLSSLFGGGDGNFDSVDTGSATVTNQVDAGSVNTDYATSTEPITVYVDPNGDDSNDGLSVDNSKQTIESAVQDAPIQNTKSQLKITLASGTYEKTDIRRLPYDSILIEGPSDQSAVIDGGSLAGYALELWFGAVTLRNIEITNGAAGCLRGNSVDMELENCYIHNGGETAIQTNLGSTLSTDEETVIDQRGVTGGRAGINILSSSFTLRGTFRGTSGNNSVIRCKEGSQGQILGATVDADGGGVCIELRKDSYSKIADVTLENAQSGISYAIGGTPVVQNSLTQNNINNLFGFSNDFYAVQNVADGYDETFIHLPRTDSAPSHWGGGAADGVAFYDSTRGVLRWYSDPLGASDGVEAGRVLIDTGTTSVPAGGKTVVNWTGSKSAGILYDAVVGIADPDDAAGDAEVDWHINWDDANGHQELVIQELGGSNGVDVQYRIHEIPQ